MLEKQYHLASLSDLTSEKKAAIELYLGLCALFVFLNSVILTGILKYVNNSSREFIINGVTTDDIESGYILALQKKTNIFVQIKGTRFYYIKLEYKILLLENLLKNLQEKAIKIFLMEIFRSLKGVEEFLDQEEEDLNNSIIYTAHPLVVSDSTVFINQFREYIDSNNFKLLNGKLDLTIENMWKKYQEIIHIMIVSYYFISLKKSQEEFQYLYEDINHLFNLITSINSGTLNMYT